MSKADRAVVGHLQPKDKARIGHSVMYDIAVMSLDSVGILDTLTISLLVFIGFGRDNVLMRTDLFRPDPR